MKLWTRHRATIQTGRVRNRLAEKPGIKMHRRRTYLSRLKNHDRIARNESDGAAPRHIRGLTPLPYSFSLSHLHINILTYINHCATRSVNNLNTERADRKDCSLENGYLYGLIKSPSRSINNLPVGTERTAAS